MQIKISHPLLVRDLSLSLSEAHRFIAILGQESNTAIILDALKWVLSTSKVEHFNESGHVEIFIHNDIWLGRERGLFFIRGKEATSEEYLESIKKNLYVLRVSNRWIECIYDPKMLLKYLEEYSHAIIPQNGSDLFLNGSISDEKGKLEKYKEQLETNSLNSTRLNVIRRSLNKTHNSLEKFIKLFMDEEKISIPLSRDIPSKLAMDLSALFDASTQCFQKQLSFTNEFSLRQQLKKLKCSSEFRYLPDISDECQYTSISDIPLIQKKLSACLSYLKREALCWIYPDSIVLGQSAQASYQRATGIEQKFYRAMYYILSDIEKALTGIEEYEFSVLIEKNMHIENVIEANSNISLMSHKHEILNLASTCRPQSYDSVLSEIMAFSPSVVECISSVIETEPEYEKAVKAVLQHYGDPFIIDHKIPINIAPFFRIFSAKFVNKTVTSVTISNRPLLPPGCFWLADLIKPKAFVYKDMVRSFFKNIVYADNNAKLVSKTIKKAMVDRDGNLYGLEFHGYLKGHMLSMESHEKTLNACSKRLKLETKTLFLKNKLTEIGTFKKSIKYKLKTFTSLSSFFTGRFTINENIRPFFSSITPFSNFQRLHMAKTCQLVRPFSALSSPPRTECNLSTIPTDIAVRNDLYLELLALKYFCKDTEKRYNRALSIIPISKRVSILDTIIMSSETLFNGDGSVVDMKPDLSAEIGFFGEKNDVLDESVEYFRFLGEFDNKNFIQGDLNEISAAKQSIIIWESASQWNELSGVNSCIAELNSDRQKIEQRIEDLESHRLFRNEFILDNFVDEFKKSCQLVFESPISIHLGAIRDKNQLMVYLKCVDRELTSAEKRIVAFALQMAAVKLVKTKICITLMDNELEDHLNNGELLCISEAILSISKTNGFFFVQTKKKNMLAFTNQQLGVINRLKDSKVDCCLKDYN